WLVFNWCALSILPAVYMYVTSNCKNIVKSRLTGLPCLVGNWRQRASRTARRGDGLGNRNLPSHNRQRLRPGVPRSFSDRQKSESHAGISFGLDVNFVSG